MILGRNGGATAQPGRMSIMGGPTPAGRGAPLLTGSPAQGMMRAMPMPQRPPMFGNIGVRGGRYGNPFMAAQLGNPKAGGRQLGGPRQGEQAVGPRMGERMGEPNMGEPQMSRGGGRTVQPPAQVQQQAMMQQRRAEMEQYMRQRMNGMGMADPRQMMMQQYMQQRQQNPMEIIMQRMGMYRGR